MPLYRFDFYSGTGTLLATNPSNSGASGVSFLGKALEKFMTSESGAPKQLSPSEQTKVGMTSSPSDPGNATLVRGRTNGSSTRRSTISKYPTPD